MRRDERALLRRILTNTARGIPRRHAMVLVYLHDRFGFPLPGQPARAAADAYPIRSAAGLWDCCARDTGHVALVDAKWYLQARRDLAVVQKPPMPIQKNV